LIFSTDLSISHKGIILTYAEESIRQAAIDQVQSNLPTVQPELAWFSQIPSTSGGLFIKSGKYLIITPTDEPALVCFDQSKFPTHEELSANQDNSFGNKVISFKFGDDDHSDVVVCAALSYNEKYLATGCVDGSVYVWGFSAMGLSKKSFRLVSKAQFHSEAVVSLGFSVDSSLLYCCGADGSFFICTIDKSTNLHYEFDHPKYSVRHRSVHIMIDLFRI
jgi:WD40 repeat protein